MSKIVNSPLMSYEVLAFLTKSRSESLLENGNRVKDTNGSYATSDNQAATHKTIKPNYDSSSYTDVEIFMPYNELEVGTGKHNLKFYCKIWEYSTSSAISVAESQYYSFTLTNN